MLQVRARSLGANLGSRTLSAPVPALLLRGREPSIQIRFVPLQSPATRSVATAWASTGLEDYDDLSEVLRRREMEEDGEEEHDSLAKVLLDRLGLPETPGGDPQPL